MLHILDRFAVHIGLQSAPSLILGVMFILAMLRRLTRYEWLPARLFPTAMLAAILVFAVAACREAFDISRGDWWGKSYFDHASWALGGVLLLLAVRKMEQWAKRGYL